MPVTSHTSDLALLRPDGLASVDVLWQQRTVERFGPLQRISIPLEGQVPHNLATSVSLDLERRWVQHRSLAPAATIGTVVAEVHEKIGSVLLVLLVTTDDDLSGDTATSLRMVRDVRRAVRDVRRRWAPASQSLAAA